MPYEGRKAYQTRRRTVRRRSAGNVCRLQGQAACSGAARPLGGGILRRIPHTGRAQHGARGAAEPYRRRGKGDPHRDLRRRPIRFESPAADTVELPEGSYPDREVEFDLPNAGITGGCELGTVKLTGVGEAGCALSGHIGTLLAGGGEMQISLSGGADKVYITGADTVLTLEAGEYPVLYCDNVSSEIVNKTDAAVTLILPNGTGVEIPRGKRYIMETGKLKTAW